MTESSLEYNYATQCPDCKVIYQDEKEGKPQVRYIRMYGYCMFCEMLKIKKQNETQTDSPAVL